MIGGKLGYELGIGQANPGIRLEPGMDEASPTLIADAWSRAYPSSAVRFAVSRTAVVTAG
jgi:hypothetical protein